MSIRTVLITSSTGADVRRVQAWLQKSGYPVPLTGQYDDDTEAAVREFQATHLDRRGKVLDVDGAVGVGGDYTWWALGHPSKRAQQQAEVPSTPAAALALAAKAPTTARAQVLSVAADELGVKEVPDGSNTGPRVVLYLDGWSPPPPWCALFVSWCLRGGERQRFSNPLAFPPHRGRASVQKIAAWGVENGRLLREPRFAGQQVEALAACGDLREPAPGDVFLMLAAGGDGVDAGRGHTGFVLAVEPDHILTVAGNEGNAVRCKRRSRATIAGYVRVVHP